MEIKKDYSSNLSLQTLEELSGRIRERLSRKDVSASIDIRENTLFHGTWAVEKQILSYIREGDTEGIRRFFHAISEADGFNTGILADTPLRQEQNLFIGLVALIGKTAAVEGGMDIEDAYRLVDIYTRECEELHTVEEVYALRYYMILDFTARVRQAKLPGDFSRCTFMALHYIAEHVLTSISVDDIAAFVGVSRSTLTRAFRADTGKSLMEYAAEAKIKEAQRLLLYTDMSISSIAEYLSFSSQPYFQTVFKKVTGKTPREFKGR